MIPKVSIIVPVYNIQKWVKKCIISLQNQTFKNIEIILVNDGSTDNSQEICENFSKKDNRIILVNKKNGGLSDARNFGLRFCKSKYVIFVDGDDYVDKDFVKQLYNAIKSTNSDVALCGYDEVDNNGKFIKRILPNEPENKNIITGNELFLYFQKQNGVVNQVAWNKIYRKELFNIFKFEKGRYYEDGYFIAPLAWYAKTITIVREPLYNYVQRSGSIIHSKMSPKKFQDSEDSYLYRIAFFKDKNKQIYKLTVRDYKNWLIHEIAKTPQNKALNVHLKRQYKKFESISSSITLKDKVKFGMAKYCMPLLIKMYSFRNSN